MQPHTHALVHCEHPLCRGSNRAARGRQSGVYTSNAQTPRPSGCDKSPVPWGIKVSEFRMSCGAPLLSLGAISGSCTVRHTWGVCASYDAP